MRLTAIDRAHDLIGKNLRTIRGNRTQVDVADATGLPQSVISRVERGDYGAVSVDLLLRLSVGLDVPPSRITNGLDEVAVIARYEAAGAA